MSEVGTLEELGLNVGDKFKSDSDNIIATYTVTALVDGGVILDWDGNNPKTGVKEMYKNTTHIYRIITRATPHPKLWRDMTSEEKGALLLAAHEGKVIDLWYEGKWGKTFPQWNGAHAYRIKPEPEVRTVTLYGCGYEWGQAEKACSDDSHRITFNTIDGKPDCTSVKMDSIT